MQFFLLLPDGNLSLLGRIPLTPKKNKVQPQKYLPNQKQLFDILTRIQIRLNEKRRSVLPYSLDSQDQAILQTSPPEVNGENFELPQPDR